MHSELRAAKIRKSGGCCPLQFFLPPDVAIDYEALGSGGGIRQLLIGALTLELPTDP